MADIPAKSPTKRPAKPSSFAPVGNSWLAAQGRLPLAFMGVALLWIVAATTLLVMRSDLLKESHILPQTIALTHAWMLGFFVTVACGAIYQLVPVALSTTLWKESLGWTHLLLHTVGVPGMVVSFWIGNYKWLGLFGTLVALGVFCFALNTWMTVKGSTRRDTVTWSIGLATGWIFLTVTAGLLLVANLIWGFIPVDRFALLRAHAHLGLVGFFLTLLQGVGFQLIPMFTLGQVDNWRFAKAGIWLSQVGLVLLIPGLVWSITPLAFLGALSITLGICSSAIGVKVVLRTRKKLRLDPGLVAFMRGGIGLGIAGFVGTTLILLGINSGLTGGGFNAMTYALLGIIGGLLPCVAGMMGKVVPFLTWMRAYGPKVGKGRTPPAHSLTHPCVEQWAFALQQVSVIPFLIGAWLKSDLWLHMGAGILAIGVLLFIRDMLGVMKHLWFPIAIEPLGKRPAQVPQKTPNNIGAEAH